MSKRNKQAKKLKKWTAGCEHKSDRRTAEFLARRLGDVQDELCDLIADMRTFEHYTAITHAGWCLITIQRLKRRYRDYADGGAWPEDS